VSTIGATQEEILSLLDSQFAQPIVEQGIPDIYTVRRNNSGAIDPYIAIQFGDLQNSTGKSFIGPRGHDYDMPIYVQCIAPDPKIARQLQNKLVNVMLGVSFDWSGNMAKRPGGGMFPMTNSNSATEAYVSASSFGLPVQFE
jgi:hypothetical protein